MRFFTKEICYGLRDEIRVDCTKQIFKEKIACCIIPSTTIIFVPIL